MEIRHVRQQNKSFWMSIDKHVSEEGFRNRVQSKTGYVIWEGDCPVGLMWYFVLWDNLPLLYLLYVIEEFRGKGYGTGAMAQWEQEMKKQGYKMLLMMTMMKMRMTE